MCITIGEARFLPYAVIMATTKTINSNAAMQQIAAEIAATLTGGQVVLLIGQLGSGKTTFTQGIALALGITQAVASPTFTIVAEYPVTQHVKIKKLVHVDLYRLDDEKAASDPALVDVLAHVADLDRLTVIEWAEKLGQSTPQGARLIQFQHGKTENERIVTYFIE